MNVKWTDRLSSLDLRHMFRIPFVICFRVAFRVMIVKLIYNVWMPYPPQKTEQETCKREDLRDIAYSVTGVITVYVANFLGPIS